MFEALVGSQAAIKFAADIIEGDHVLALQVKEIFGLFADAANKKAIKELQRIKGRGKVPLAVIMHTEDALRLTDLENVLEAAREVLFEARMRAGGRTHIRIPVLNEFLSAIPEAVLSCDNGMSILQFLDPTGIMPLTMLVDELKRRGIHFLAATSMNKNGQKVITDFESAVKFSRLHKLQLLLRSDEAKYGQTGKSFPIVSFLKNETGIVQGIREGDQSESLHVHLGVSINW